MKGTLLFCTIPSLKHDSPDLNDVGVTLLSRSRLRIIPANIIFGRLQMHHMNVCMMPWQMTDARLSMQINIYIHDEWEEVTRSPKKPDNSQGPTGFF